MFSPVDLKEVFAEIKSDNEEIIDSKALNNAI